MYATCLISRCYIPSDNFLQQGKTNEKNISGRSAENFEKTSITEMLHNASY